MAVEGKKTDTHNRVIEKLAAMDDKPEIDGVDTDSAVDDIAAFDEVVVWGHENPAETNNVFVRGVDEWVTFAEAVSSHCSTRPISSV